MNRTRRIGLAAVALVEFALPPFYELHAWVWKHNLSGRFATGIRPFRAGE